ncbi:putative transmembrane anti-sigma factor [Thermincola ferriacetica]|uniref:Anti-sigma-W factor RsiW n=1 Tax=Thermincola ferriacetica TaxID=281456 RepID=A0A0L6W4H1_9FIRM|nr:zf-HC2 domain-containing protein [Thermincola ferriacetica]KNZ70462.1 putative transmembrane anti-sigma factor [Thermincola ferriacetica]
MNCKECRYLLFDYVDNKLTPDTKEIIDEHLQVCPECAARMEALQVRQEELEQASGMFFYLFKPSGGFKRLFIIASLLTALLFAILTYLHLKNLIF